MAEYTIDKIEYGGNVYKLQDNVSGYVTTEVFYGTCATAAATAAKVVTCENFSASDLKAGTIIVVYFSATNSGAVGDLTLNVNNTGAKSIKYINNGTKGNLTSAGYLKASTSYPFLYDGTNWLALINYNTTYSEISEANITNGSSSSTGLVSGRRAKAAVGAFESIADVTVNGTSVVANRVAAITVPTLPSNNVTGSGSVDYLARWSGTNTLSSTSLSISTSYNSSSDSYGTINLYVGSTGQIDWKGQLVFHDGSASKTITITPPSLTADRVITLPDKTGTIALTSDIPTVPSNIVNTITTAAGAHTAITSQKGNVSFNIPTTAAHVGAASSSHTHGNITNGGDITATAPTIANGDQIVINDNSASKITNGPTFDGSTTTTALTPKGTWETFSKFSGSYNDLTDKPTIPTVPSNIVNTITTTAGTHTAITSQKGNVSFNVPTKTSHLTNDSGFITNAGVTSITTTAGTHTTISSSTGAVSFNVPTKTSHLTNDSGFITSYTDEKLKWTASTSTNTYYPLVSTSTATTSTANTLNGINFYQYYNTAGGYRRLELGNATANQSTGGAYGAIRLFGANATYYGDLVPGNPELGSGISGAGLSANRTWKIPDKSGTIALTSDLSGYIHKPSDDGYYGYVLKYETSSSTFWDVPNTYQFGIFEESPGTYNYYGGDMAGEIQDAAVGGRCLVLQLDLINSATDLLETYMLTDYRMQWIDTNDGAYSVLWFTDTFRIIGESLKRITVGIYLDETEVEHEYGEITVDVKEIGERYTINGGDTGYTTNISTTADQFKQLAVLNLPAGKWIVSARARFTPTSSSNHYSAINIGTVTAGSGSTTTGNAIRDRRYGEGTYFNQHALTRILSLATDGPVYLNGGGSNVAGTWNRTNDVFQFDAIRIT